MRVFERLDFFGNFDPKWSRLARETPNYFRNARETPNYFRRARETLI